IIQVDRHYIGNNPAKIHSTKPDGTQALNLNDDWRTNAKARVLYNEVVASRSRG
ncbi:6540_t:CDS:1, partial [Paraglomus brasilianum]